MNIPVRGQFRLKHLKGQSRQFIHSRRRRIILGCTLGVISIVSLIFVASKLTHLAFFDIQEINIIGADIDIKNALQASALEAIQGDYMGLFAKSNFLAYPKNTIVKALVGMDARINSIKVNRNGLNSLNITVNEKIPAAVVCTNLPTWNESDLVADSLDSCYFVDSIGFVYMNATTSITNINRYYMPNLADTVSSTSIIGIQVASTTTFKSLQSYYNSAVSYGILVKALLAKGGGEYELYAKTDSGIVVIYFNEINGFENELVALISFWNEINNKASDKGGILELDSIDLRYGSNVFYRTTK
jgi:hypothetical protein